MRIKTIIIVLICLFAIFCLSFIPTQVWRTSLQFVVAAVILAICIDRNLKMFDFHEKFLNSEFTYAEYFKIMCGAGIKEREFMADIAQGIFKPDDLMELTILYAKKLNGKKNGTLAILWKANDFISPPDWKKLFGPDSYSNQTALKDALRRNMKVYGYHRLHSMINGIGLNIVELSAGDLGMIMEKLKDLSDYGLDDVVHDFNGQLLRTINASRKMRVEHGSKTA